MVWRTLWQSVAALLVFAQVAAAAEQCVPERLTGERHVISGAVADANHDLDDHCAGGLAPAAQAPASEAKRVVPDVGVIASAAWRPAPEGAAPPAAYAHARAGPSLPLQFRNLRL